VTDRQANRGTLCTAYTVLSQHHIAKKATLCHTAIFCEVYSTSVRISNTKSIIF